MKQHPVLVLTMFALLVASPSGGTRAAPASATGASVAAVSGSRSLDLRLPAGLATSPTQVQAPAQSDPQPGSANATPAPLAARTSVGAGGAAAGGDPGVEDDEAREADGVATLRAGGLLARFGPQKLAYTSLIHADLGGHNLKKNDAFARRVSPLIEPLLATGGLMVSSDRMYFDMLAEMPLPPGAVEGRCFIYRC